MSRSVTLYPNNSQFIELQNLLDIDANPAVFPPDMALTATLTASNGNPVTGLNAVVGILWEANSTYRFQVDGSIFNPPTGYAYTLTIDGERASTGYRYHAESRATVKVRTTGLESAVIGWNASDV